MYDYQYPQNHKTYINLGAIAPIYFQDKMLFQDNKINRLYYIISYAMRQKKGRNYSLWNQNDELHFNGAVTIDTVIKKYLTPFPNQAPTYRIPSHDQKSVTICHDEAS